MADCKPCSTPMDLDPKLSAEGDLVFDPTDFHSLVVALQYLTFIKSDIPYAVQQVYLHMHDPREPHLAALKRILRYVRGTLHMGLFLRPSTQSDLVVYSDADWADCPDTHKSTSGHAVFLSDNLVSWSSKRQNIVSHSNAVLGFRLSNELLPTPLLNPPGYANFCLSCTLLCPRQPWCTLTTSSLPTCLQIPFSICSPSMWRSISISCRSVLHLVMCVSFMSQHLSSPTFSPKGCLRQSSRNFGLD